MNDEPLSRLFLQQRHMLLSYLHALVREANDAEDLFQEVGVRVMASQQVPADPAEFAAWCRGIARNLVLHHWRSKRRSRVEIGERLLDALETAYRQAEPGAELLQERSQALADCLRGLSERSREVVEQRYFQGLTSAEIGAQLDRTAEAVRKMLARIRAQLEECIEHRLAAGGAS